MAVTPNYGWPVPVATDLVKDGYAQIASLGNAIDATVYGLGSSGLVLIKTQTIGTGVASVTVTGAFSTTFSNYKILISGGVASSFCNLALSFPTATTGYYWSHLNYTFTGGQANANTANGTDFAQVTRPTSKGISGNIELDSPFLAARTKIRYANLDIETNGSMSYGAGFLDNSTSFTSFTITPAGQTLTGGTIRVYGYQN